jgi:hypothetical protein
MGFAHGRYRPCGDIDKQEFGAAASTIGRS